MEFNINPKQFEKELAAQRSAIFEVKLIFAGCVVVSVLTGIYLTWAVGGVMLMLSVLAFLIKYPILRRDLLLRSEQVAFKTQVKPIFVFQNPGEPSAMVVQTAEMALTRLATNGNEAQVRVYWVLKGDVKAFCEWWDNEGKKQSKIIDRPDGSSYESWEQYAAWCEGFRCQMMEETLRRLRESPITRKWVDEFWFE